MKSHREKLRKTTGAYIDQAFFPELKNRFESKGFNNIRFELEPGPESARKIDLFYTYVIQSPAYLQPRVKIEIGCRSLREPFTFQSIVSWVDESFPEAGFSHPAITIPTVNHERTFVEKIFLLHEEFQRPHENMRVERLSRHLYDIVKLSKTGFAVKALSDPILYATIVEHRYKFTRIGGVNYIYHQPQTINPIPFPSVIDATKADYNTMREQMIFEQNPPTFDQVIRDLAELKNKINALPWQFQTRFPAPIQNSKFP